MLGEPERLAHRHFMELTGRCLAPRVRLEAGRELVRRGVGLAPEPLTRRGVPQHLVE